MIEGRCGCVALLICASHVDPLHEHTFGRPHQVAPSVLITVINVVMSTVLLYCIGHLGKRYGVRHTAWWYAMIVAAVDMH